MFYNHVQFVGIGYMWLHISDNIFQRTTLLRLERSKGLITSWFTKKVKVMT